MNPNVPYIDDTKSFESFIRILNSNEHDDVMKWKHFPRYWPGPGEFPAQRPVTRSFDVFFDLRPNKRLSKQPWG